MSYTKARQFKIDEYFRDVFLQKDQTPLQLFGRPNRPQENNRDGENKTYKKAIEIKNYLFYAPY